MFKALRTALLASTFLVAVATPATANPLALVVGAQKFFAVTFGPRLGAFLYNLAGSALLGAASNALRGSGSRPQADVKRELAAPTSRPPYRHVYGHVRMIGTPLPVRVKNTVMYIGLLLNSRPSAGTNLSIYFDRRAATVVTGDMFDFAGNGAVLSIEGFQALESSTSLRNPRVWLQLGDETAPPDVFVNEAPEYFSDTDGWQGRTVLWLRMDAGESQLRSERWPRVPPEIEVQMDYSLVYDMRKTGHDPDDASTWEYSANHALCTLDALRTNPIAQYPLDMLNLDIWEIAADVADESVSLKAGGTEPRYETNGFIVFNANEILSQLAPMEIAGGGSFIRVGGQLAYAPGAYATSVHTVTDIIEEGGIDLQTLAPGRDTYYAVRASYTAVDRDWQPAELPQIAVPGASTGNSDVQELSLGAFVTSATQAMRIQQITARQLAAQRTLSCMLWPDAINAIGGSTLTFNLPSGFERVNGTWRVLSANPGLWAAEDAENGGVAMRIPVSLQQTSASIYEWVPETDELDLEVVAFDPIREVTIDADLPQPSDLAAEAYWEDTIRVTATQPQSSFVDGVEFLAATTTDFDDAAAVGSDFPGPGGDAAYNHDTLSPGATRRYWARSIAFPNSRSEPIGFVAETVAADFTGVTATALLGAIRFTGTAPSFTGLTHFRVFRAAVGAGYGAASQIGSDVAATPGAAYTVTIGTPGTNLFTNGDMASATGWTLDPDISIGSGVMTKVAGATPRYASQSPSMTAADTLRVGLSVPTYTAGSVRVRARGATDNDSALQAATGQLLSTVTVPASPTSLTLLFTAPGDMTVDNAVAYVQGGSEIAQGEYDFFIAPVREDGVVGTPAGPFTRIIV